MATRSNRATPPEIRRKLQALKHQKILISEFQSRLAAAELECSRLEGEIYEYRASIAPIKKCPPEVLAIIFELYLCDNPTIICRLLLVCRQWYQITISTSRLWSRIPIKIRYTHNIENASNSIKRRLEMSLKRSGSVLLELDLDFSGLCHFARWSARNFTTP